MITEEVVFEDGSVGYQQSTIGQANTIIKNKMDVVTVKKVATDMPVMRARMRNELRRQRDIIKPKPERQK